MKKEGNKTLKCKEGLDMIENQYQEKVNLQNNLKCLYSC